MTSFEFSWHFISLLSLIMVTDTYPFCRKILYKSYCIPISLTMSLHGRFLMFAKYRTPWKGYANSAKQQLNRKQSNLWSCHTWMVQRSLARVTRPFGLFPGPLHRQLWCPGSLTPSVKLLMKYMQNDFDHSPKPLRNLINKPSLDQHVRIRVHMHTNLAKETFIGRGEGGGDGR
jgi:hypothetical protein